MRLTWSGKTDACSKDERLGRLMQEDGRGRRKRDERRDKQERENELISSFVSTEKDLGSSCCELVSTEKDLVANS